MWQGLGHILLLEVGEQQHQLNVSVELLYTRKGHTKSLQRYRKWGIDNDEIASLEQRLNSIALIGI
jgi:hypothetical protein